MMREKRTLMEWVSASDHATGEHLGAGSKVVERVYRRRAKEVEGL